MASTEQSTPSAPEAVTSVSPATAAETEAHQGDVQAYVPPPAPLSKNAQKKAIRTAKYQQNKLQKKLDKKRKRQEEQEQKRQEAAQRSPLTAEEKEAARRHKEEQDKIRAEKHQQKKARMDELRLQGQRVIVDLSFDDLMTEREVKSLVVQLAHSYAYNRRSDKPINLIYSSLDKRTLELLSRYSGFDSWAVEKFPQHFTEKYDKSEMIYLSADATETITTLDPSKVYIIGGMVDHNRLKGHCQAYAEKLGLATAKLPLTNIDMDGRKVLTVNHGWDAEMGRGRDRSKGSGRLGDRGSGSYSQRPNIGVVQILLSYHNKPDWPEAILTALPPRKNAALGGGGGAGGSHQGDSSDGDGDGDGDDGDSRAVSGQGSGAGAGAGADAEGSENKCNSDATDSAAV